MSKVNETVAGYIAAWNETDAGRRRDIIARTWSEDGSYLDAHRNGIGHASIDAVIAATQERFPGYRFRLCSGIEMHHDRAFQLVRRRYGEVDVELGIARVIRYTAVQDVGRAIHPGYVEGQLQGGVAQSIGWALNEEYIYTQAHPRNPRARAT